MRQAETWLPQVSQPQAWLRDPSGVPLFIYARPEKTATESLTRHLGIAFNRTHKFTQSLDRCEAERKTMHCGVWTNIRALNEDRGEHRTRGHHTLDELCAVAAPLPCEHILKFGVARSPWQRELSNYMWTHARNHWTFRRGRWVYAHGGEEDVRAFQTAIRTASSFLRPTSAFLHGAHPADVVLRFEHLQRDVDVLLRDVIGVGSPGRLPSAKQALGDSNHAVELDHWFRGCCDCIARIGQWHQRDADLYNFTPPKCV